MTKHDLKEMRNLGAELGAAKAEIEALREQVKALQSDANSWQSGYDKGRNDGGKHRKSEVEQLRQHKNDYMDAAEATRKALLAEIESLRNGLKNARYRIEQGRVWNGMGWTLTGLHAHQQQKALDEIDAALSQQPEPTDTYTAVEMATAAAQGFRDGQAAVEPAPAQDERGDELEAIHQYAFEVGGTEGGRYMLEPEELDEVARRACEPYEDVLRSLACSLGAGGYNALTVDPAVFEQKIRWGIDQLTRPAQTEQQPTVKDCLTVQPIAYAVFADNGNVACFSTQREHPSLVAFEADGHSVVSLAPIAQTAPQGKLRMGDLVRKTSGSEWEGHICGTYSTELTPEGYAVESAAHKGSVQIYPAKALEAV